MHRAEREKIFREWLERHRRVLEHVVRGFASPAERDDLLQEMLLALWHAVPRFRSEAAVTTYIYRVAQNTALTWRRGLARRPLTEPLDIERHGVSDSPAHFERTEALYAAVRRLPELDRALVLLYLEEISYRDIADVLGMSVSNVGVRLNRARATLAAMIREKT